MEIGKATGVTLRTFRPLCNGRNERVSRSVGQGMRKIVVAGAVVLVAVAAFVLVWFQPQKLVMDDTVVEEAPATATTVTLLRGTLGDRAHHASGRVKVQRLADGSYALRLEGLDVENGPDLYVYLTPAAADAPNGAIDDGAVSLGRLKGNKGDQTYVVPASADLGKHRTVAIWCKRFSVVFGTAALSA